MKHGWKGHKDGIDTRKKQNQKTKQKRSGQARLASVKRINRNILSWRKESASMHRSVSSLWWSLLYDFKLEQFRPNPERGSEHPVSLWGSTHEAGVNLSQRCISLYGQCVPFVVVVLFFLSVLGVNQPSLLTLFALFLRLFPSLWPFNYISFQKFSWQFSPFLTLFYWSYFCLIGPFSYISLHESLPQPW